MTPDPIFTAAILAGGQARRLGGIDKSALVVDASSILERQVSLLRALTPHVFMVANDMSRARTIEIPVIPDRIAGAGALGGIYTALMHAPTEQVLVVGCDMPFLNAPFVTYLMEQGRDADATVPRDGRGRHPLCASYARRIAGHLKVRIDAGDLRVGGALLDLAVRELGPDELAPFDRDGRLLFNINTPEDYARARATHPGSPPA